MTSPARKALLCSAAVFVLACLALFATLGKPAGTDGAAEAMGRLLALTVIAGIVCAWMARRSAVAWGWPRFVTVYLVCCVALLALTAYSHRADAAGMPRLTVTWPPGWAPQHLDGASSDARDRDVGFRERAVLGEPKLPRAVMEFGCAHGSDPGIGVEAQLAHILDGVTHGFEEKGFEVSRSAAFASRIGKREGFSAILLISHSGQELVQSFSLAPGADCVLSATFAGNKTEYYANLSAYTDAKDSVRVVTAP